MLLIRALAAAAGLLAAVPADADPLGAIPAQTQRTLTEKIPNADAVTWRAWVPGLDEGFVPQDLTVAEGALLLATYRGNAGCGCRLYRLDPDDGGVTGMTNKHTPSGSGGGPEHDVESPLFLAATVIMLATGVEQVLEGGGSEI